MRYSAQLVEFVSGQPDVTNIPVFPPALYAEDEEEFLRLLGDKARQVLSVVSYHRVIRLFAGFRDIDIKNNTIFIEKAPSGHILHTVDYALRLHASESSIWRSPTSHNCQIFEPDSLGSPVELDYSGMLSGVSSVAEEIFEGALTALSPSLPPGSRAGSQTAFASSHSHENGQMEIDSNTFIPYQEFPGRTHVQQGANLASAQASGPRLSFRASGNEPLETFQSTPAALLGFREPGFQEIVGFGSLPSHATSPMLSFWWYAQQSVFRWNASLPPLNTSHVRLQPNDYELSQTGQSILIDTFTVGMKVYETHTATFPDSEFRSIDKKGEDSNGRRNEL